MPLAKNFWPLGTYHKMKKTSWLLSFRLSALAPANLALNSIFWLYHLLFFLVLLNLVTMLLVLVAQRIFKIRFLLSEFCHANYLSTVNINPVIGNDLGFELLAFLLRTNSKRSSKYSRVSNLFSFVVFVYIVSCICICT